MEVRQIMTSKVESIARDTPVLAIATAMRDRQIGALPVVEQGRVIGMITDRDIVTRFLTEYPRAMDVVAEAIMSSGVLQCYEDQTIADIAAIMGDHQIRRLPVLDRNRGMAGIVSIGDIAEKASERIAGEALGEIVEAR
ncbi:MAG: CBS domain-containing protein [Rhodobacter sp.]|nr:CBS domain-containing protein [Rhodobacter sp.]